MGYVYIAGTIFLTVFGQLLIKWRMDQQNNLPIAPMEKFIYMFKLLLDPFILLGLISAFVASLLWMLVLTKFELSYAYPFTGATYVFILISSYYLFHESISWTNMVGVSLIVLGIVISSR
jgi:multidrug transporter EmrE-like cation transporter